MTNANSMNAAEAEETLDGPSAANEDLFDTLLKASVTAKNGAKDMVQLAGAEWWLSLRALTLALLSLTCLAMLLVVLWLSVVGGVALWAYGSNLDPVGIWLGLIAAHVLMVFWLWKQVRQFLQMVGFRQTVQAIVSPKVDKNDE